MINLQVSKEKTLSKKKPLQKVDKKQTKSKERNKRKAVSSYDEKHEKNSREKSTFLTPFENNKGRNKNDKQCRSQTRNRRKHHR